MFGNEYTKYRRLNSNELIFNLSISYGYNADGISYTKYSPNHKSHPKFIPKSIQVHSEVITVIPKSSVIPKS